MKNGWEVKKLGELFDITSSKRVFESDWRTEGVPFYRAREIVKLAQHGFVDNELFISEEMFSRYSTKHGSPTEGDIMVTGVGTLGICYVVRKGDRFYFKDGNIIWLKKRSLADSRFVEYAFQSDSLRKQIEDSVGATVGTYTIIKAKNTLISVPPLPEQQRIVRILDEVIERVTTAKANAEKNLQNARAIFESCLQSVLTQHGEGWVERKLSELCAITSTLVDPRKDEFLDLIHVGAGNIASQTGALVELKTAREEGLISGKFLFDESMVLYSKIRPYLMKVARPDFSGLCSADIYPLAPLPNQITRDYLFHLLLSKPFTEYAIQGSARAGMPKVNRERLFEFRAWVPTLAKQEELARKLDALHEETQHLESVYQQKLAALEALKKSLLHQAFSGEL
jgi:type I restriction enzyme S subunit